MMRPVRLDQGALGAVPDLLLDGAQDAGQVLAQDQLLQGGALVLAPLQPVQLLGGQPEPE